MAIDTVPSTFNLGRRTRPTSVRAAEVDEEEGTNLSVPADTSDAPFRSTMSTQTLQAQAATSQTAAGDLASTNKPPIQKFFEQKKSSGSGPPGAPGSGPPGGGNPGNPPSGNGPIPPPPPPGGGGGAGGGGGGHGGGNGKLTGNPPSEFNGDRSKADTFMNEFDLYVLANIDTDTMASPMKKATIFLSYIKGELVQDWTKRWVQWMLRQYQLGRPAYDPYYWDTVSDAFRSAFQDTGARERAEYKLKNFPWDPVSVDAFIATFESLANQAGYDINGQPTLTALASKLPFSMMNHIVKIVRPQNFAQWCDAIRQYHVDNTAVNNLKGLGPGDQAPQKKKRNSRRNDRRTVGSYPRSQTPEGF